MKYLGSVLSEEVVVIRAGKGDSRMGKIQRTFLKSFVTRSWL